MEKRILQQKNVADSSLTNEQNEHFKGIGYTLYGISLTLDQSLSQH